MDGNDPDSVTAWIEQLKAGDGRAAQVLWERYFHRLVGLARTRLQALKRRAAADEEDVAISAFKSFCLGAERGKFPQLSDRDGLWALLVTITTRKARHLIRDEHCQKRGGGEVLGESALFGPANEPARVQGVADLLGREPSPEFAAQVAEEFERLLALLDDDELRCIAVWKMESHTVKEIADKLDCAPATVERRLALIRKIWGQEHPTTAP